MFLRFARVYDDSLGPGFGTCEGRVLEIAWSSLERPTTNSGLLHTALCKFKLFSRCDPGKYRFQHRNAGRGSALSLKHSAPVFQAVGMVQHEFTMILK